jgi:hypothetical protein
LSLSSLRTAQRHQGFVTLDALSMQEQRICILVACPS